MRPSSLEGTSRVYISKSCEPRRCRRPRKRKMRKNNIEEKERIYLVLRVCRACNHRGTAKRPSTPSHSASRHSIFFSSHPLRPCRCARALLFPGVPRLSRTDRVSLFTLVFLPFASSAASIETRYSIIIISCHRLTADSRASRLLSRFPPFNYRLFVRLHPEFHYILLRIDR